MRTANLAIVFTDIKGFTERTSQQTLEENQHLLETHSRLLTPLFHSFAGKVVKSIGDAFMVTFESPTQAVLCGAAIQDRLWVHNRGAPSSERLEVRVAINVGEVRLENKDAFGEPVNIAARVEGIAEAGEIYFTEAVYLAMNKAEVPSVEVGDFELKGIPGKIKVYKVPHAPYRVEAPGADPGPAGAERGEVPPYGNLGLSKVGPHTRRATAELRLPGRPAWLNLKRVGPPAAGILIVLALGLALGSNEIEESIEQVADAPEGQRSEWVRKAEALIDRVKSPEEKLWYLGQLEEAQARYGAAVSDYKAAARRGSSPAEKRIRELIQSDECPARAAAARAAGELKMKAARSALEDLAEEGGPGEGGGGLLGTGLGSCDSRGAAREALRQLQ